MPDEQEQQNSTDEQSDGTPANPSEVSPGTTAQNTTIQNDPAKNKKISELKTIEPFREYFSFELILPGIYPGIKTNQFIWIPVSDTFYDDMYAELLTEIGPSKFNRYAGFEKDRFYISRKKWTYDINNGVQTSLTVNPFPSMYSEYMKYQLEAERALDQAIIDATRGKGAAAPANVSGVDCTPDDGLESDHWAGHRCKPPKCTASSKVIRGNSSRQYAKDTAAHNTSSKDLVTYVSTQVEYERYGDNPKGASRCPEAMWTGGRPIRGNCADFARMLKCILDVNGYQSIVCHIPGHFYNAIWENNSWTICDLCHSPAYGHANHENEAGSPIPVGTWDNPVG